jgi:glycosyltransferase involved in cell wall biosynthesis
VSGQPPPDRGEAAPTVSVVVPTYNRAGLLPRALDSALAQTFGDLEVLVVDDGSTDATAALVNGYAARDGRVRYLRQPENAGVSAARNRGLREARGALVAFLDSDDEWLPYKLARQVDLFRRSPEAVGLVYGGVENVGPGGERTVHTPRHGGDLYRALLERNVIHGTSGVVLRRSAAARAGPFDEGIPAIEDWEYWIRVARHAEAAYVPEPLIRYYEPDDIERKTLNTRDNLDARAWLYRTHGAAMRRAGTASAFLLESARRHRAAGEGAAALALALRSIARAPRSYPAYPFLLETALPPRLFGRLRRVRRRDRSPL